MTGSETTNGNGSVEFGAPAALSFGEEPPALAFDEPATLGGTLNRTEITSPSAEYPLPEAEITAPGRGLSPAAQEDADRRNRRHRRIKQLIGYTTAAAVVAVTVLGPAKSFWGPVPDTSPGSEGRTPPEIIIDEPDDERTPIRTVLAEHPDWYCAEYGVYLHFNEGVGWVYDHGNFHRLIWVIEGDGTDGERLYVKTGYMYYAGSGKRTTIEKSVYVDVSELEEGSFTLAGALGVEGADGATATFAPVDGIPVDSSVVDGFGAMSAQAILEAIGSFAATEIRPQTGEFKWTSLVLSGGGVVASMSNGDSISVGVTYDRQLVPHFETGYFEYSTANKMYRMSGTFSGGAQFREDGVYVSFSAIGGGDAIFVAGSVPSFVTPSPVVPAAEAPAQPAPVEEADEAFPGLPNLWPDTPVEPWGSLGEYYVIFDEDVYVVAGEAYGGEVDSYPGASYDAATNTLTLTDCSADFLEVNWMGNGFTINLVGDNHLGGLLVWGFHSGGSVTFTGTGSLTVNEGLGNDCGIFLVAEGSRSCVMVDRGVTLDAYGSEAAIFITEAVEGQAIYYLSPLKMTGGVRAAVGQNEDGQYGDYSVIDAFGDPSTHVHFGE